MTIEEWERVVFEDNTLVARYPGVAVLVELKRLKDFGTIKAEHIELL